MFWSAILCKSGQVTTVSRAVQAGESTIDELLLKVIGNLKEDFGAIGENYPLNLHRQSAQAC